MDFETSKRSAGVDQFPSGGRALEAKRARFSRRSVAVAAGAAATLVAGVAIAATLYSSYGATSTSNMVDGNHTTYGVLQALTGGSMPSCPPGFSYWINSGAGTRGCIKGLSSSWRIMGWTLIDLGPSIGTSCGTGCTVVPAWDAANQV